MERLVTKIKVLYRLICSWRTVRAFGSVRILTRASYAMLVVVPVLAALWPFVQLVVGESKKDLLVLAQKLDASAEQLKSSTRHDPNTSTTSASVPSTTTVYSI